MVDVITLQYYVENHCNAQLRERERERNWLFGLDRVRKNYSNKEK